MSFSGPGAIQTDMTVMAHRQTASSRPSSLCNHYAPVTSTEGSGLGQPELRETGVMAISRSCDAS